MSRKAVIDCGTNTFNLRIVDFNESLGPGSWKNVFSLRLLSLEKEVLEKVLSFKKELRGGLML